MMNRFFEQLYMFAGCPGFFVSLFLLLNLLGCRTSPPETFVLPEGFIGHVIILYGQTSGQAGPRFSIPSDGILRVSGAARSADSSTKYIFRGKDEREVRIVYLDHWGSGKTLENITADEASSEVFVFNDGGVGSFEVNGKTMKYRAFLVGHPAQRALMYDAMIANVFRIKEELSQRPMRDL